MYKSKCPKCSSSFYLMGLNKLVGQTLKCHNCGHEYVFTNEMKNKLKNKPYLRKIWDSFCGVLSKVWRSINKALDKICENLAG